MVKSVRLAAHPNTLLLMSSAASYGVGEKGVDIMVTTAEHAHENRAKGDVEGSLNQDEDDEWRTRARTMITKETKQRIKRTKNSKKMSASSNIRLVIEIWRTTGALRVRGRLKLY